MAQGSQPHQDRRVVLVTGANRGIGFELCRLLADAGYETLLSGRDLHKVRGAAALLPGTVPLLLDVDRPESIATAAAFVDERYGRLDVLVNNAAGGYDRGTPTSTADLRVVEATLRTDLFGPWRTIQAFLPLLRRSAHPRIVNVSSATGATTSKRGDAPAYAIAKGGLNTLTRLLAHELAGEGILVNAVTPGVTATGMSSGRGRPVQEGAAGILWAIALPDGGPTGTFTRDGQPVPW